ncbi:hypothetical protein QE450_000846 [Paenibacillus sp. SORGH_AS306]|uniref:hypothetical protein n=1 Tax=unclassified Paenibacillus TaxID=185978 RepID=UPI002785B28B|nr:MULTISPECIES: hypothetical protein [unclassified Paenibacillus]MDQ1233348.1 hypothetical protein [Paenibacillus sp. SORGH_AS_0306]MDR6110389.1 hypothetical protein [Paenibacillus sp. SORGH_AS_0338]
MTQPELYEHLKSLGYPVAYSHFTATENSPVPNPPYLIYLFSYSSDVMADNQNFVPISTFQVELYTAKKDLGAEKLVQDKLKAIRMPYSKTEIFIETENLYQVVYDIKLMGE